MAPDTIDVLVADRPPMADHLLETGVAPAALTSVGALGCAVPAATTHDLTFRIWAVPDPAARGTSYCHCSRSRPLIVRVPSEPRKRCCLAGFSGAQGRSVRITHASQVLPRAVWHSASSP